VAFVLAERLLCVGVHPDDAVDGSAVHERQREHGLYAVCEPGDAE
jgi:hypothetical protein